MGLPRRTVFEDSNFTDLSQPNMSVGGRTRSVRGRTTQHLSCPGGGPWNPKSNARARPAKLNTKNGAKPHCVHDELSRAGKTKVVAGTCSRGPREHADREPLPGPRRMEHLRRGGRRRNDRAFGEWQPSSTASARFTEKRYICMESERRENAELCSGLLNRFHPFHDEEPGRAAVVRGLRHRRIGAGRRFVEIGEP